MITNVTSSIKIMYHGIPTNTTIFIMIISCTGCKQTVSSCIVIDLRNMIMIHI